MTDAAIKAAYHTYNRVLGRKVLQIVLEVPLEQEGAVHASIGYPAPDGSTWVAIARLQEPEKQTEKPKRSWGDMPRSQQAGMKCADLDFRRYLAGRFNCAIGDEKWAAALVSDFCGVTSRSDIDKQQHTADLWDRLYSDYQLHRRGAKAA